MDLATDRIEPPADWMMAACGALIKLPDLSEIDHKRLRTATKIIASIEADCIPVPEIRRDKAGWITILFRQGERSVEFIVAAPDVFHVFRFGPYERSRKTMHRGWPGEPARAAIRWLYPTSHATDEDGMYQVMREGI